MTKSVAERTLHYPVKIIVYSISLQYRAKQLQYWLCYYDVMAMSRCYMCRMSKVPSGRLQLDRVTRQTRLARYSGL